MDKYKVGFATTYLEDKYPLWPVFKQIVINKFTNPMVQKVHKQKMKEYKMGNKLATKSSQILAMTSQREQKQQEQGVKNTFSSSNTSTKPDGSTPTSSYSKKKTSMSTTFTGMGKPIDVDQLKKEGKCFNCGQKDHMVQDCLQKKNKHIQEDLRALIAELQKEEEDLSLETKVEEVKDGAEQ
ncbi:uncharacterized protein BT62DRAFT_922602 [Guyanagaster necrorhizus]|uniref:CCHC-type domain-containing protein n=1 Tax=Guyanagaster necrorhizus TaxID=856835 RepID=A0A9P7VJR8_9AGAR|nr:uncharacterized protein BT62DRAFT_922602 [Guyanagaster necrorhizus MCA 3950]KAG7442411.1 hypothetical protein BT62DRAFT_922602 [Guyanagaster necrorhizus MCA 3950]